MNSYQEKLSILSELIAFARVDYKMKDDEYDFLLSVANLMEVKNHLWMIFSRIRPKYPFPEHKPIV